MVKTCSCASPIPYQDGDKERCARCWTFLPTEQEQPYSPPPPSVHAPIQTTIEWARHWHERGWTQEAIGKELGVSTFLVEAITRKDLSNGHGSRGKEAG